MSLEYNLQGFQEQITLGKNWFTKKCLAIMIIENKPHYFLKCLVQVLFLELFWQKILKRCQQTVWNDNHTGIRWCHSQNSPVTKMKGIASWFLQESNLHAYNMVHIAESYCARKYISICNMLKILWVPWYPASFSYSLFGLRKQFFLFLSLIFDCFC